MAKQRVFRVSSGQKSSKCMMFFALTLAVCFCGATAWGVPDYNFTITDGACDAVTPQYQFGNGFDLIDSNGTASHAADTITVNVRVNGGIGNANQETGITAGCLDAGFLSDTNPQIGNAASCNNGNCDAPGDAGTIFTDEQYTIQIAQGAFLAQVLYQPAKGTPNVSVPVGGVTVTPTFIDPTTLADKQQFTIVIGGLSAAGFNFGTSWSIRLAANSLVDGPGEDLANATVEPPEPPALECTKVFDVDQVDPGDVITATVTITNSGPTVTSVDATDTLDAGLSFVQMVSGPDPNPNPPAGQVISWSNLGPIAANGGVLTLQYQVSVDAIDPGETLCNDFYGESTDWPGVHTSHCVACVGREIPPPPGVPTFTQWGIIGFALLLAIGGVCLIRRRRVIS